MRRPRRHDKMDATSEHQRGVTVADSEQADQASIASIDALVDEEHRLRAHGSAITDDDRGRLREIEAELDRRWDLLRRRRAAHDFGTDAGAASAQQVHDYLQ